MGGYKDATNERRPRTPGDRDDAVANVRGVARVDFVDFFGARDLRLRRRRRTDRDGVISGERTADVQSKRCAWWMLVWNCRTGSVGK